MTSTAASSVALHDDAPRTSPPISVLLGVRPLGLTQSFPPLGRETFITPVSWVDGGPQPEPVRLAPRDAVDEEVFDFADPSALADPGWLGGLRHDTGIGRVGQGRPTGDHRPWRAGRPAPAVRRPPPAAPDRRRVHHRRRLQRGWRTRRAL